ncbi:MAG: preprotein translocase subunit SecG [Myxococcales bacterium]|nr:preprotein translocase subunit SecG [Myxococcales bacterium]
MTLFITTLHVLTCLALIAIVLLQHGKGADLGATFGGGASQTVFGGRGAGNFLTKLTTGAAILFMLTSLTLSYFAAPGALPSAVPVAPAPEPSAPAPPELPSSSFPEAVPLEEGGGEVPSGFEAIEPPAAPK